ncbi:unnamed protein product [Didymodactylos carnosus]|uniref:Uncharacterized protein n=1 Tax=Didymodactylos carnosus TaxID=1234261 RepID=A0A814DAL5_9BILA|nr:unnamed protein product [Didymodactylos carnosus]CAF1287835.1 unnamed protein product [Didymodactylos carnosus]CAF3726799.1 unnamed protein product [Didymodactylos carnosus]CAF4092772.1 unnamed protein product [Didymodactylos carnosus]
MGDHAASIMSSTVCTSPMCSIQSEIRCRHCDEVYCYLCFMSHRKNIFDEMMAIRKQMIEDRRQGVAEVTKFIDKQAQDAKEQAKALVDDALERLKKASENIYNYIDNRRQAKLARIEESLHIYDNEIKNIDEFLDHKRFLGASRMSVLRKLYGYNMFYDNIHDEKNSSKLMVPVVSQQQRENEKFFGNYRYYDELINLREKWPFLQRALTTVYFPARKDISLDKIITFLEYRHDRVLENYREHLNETKSLSNSITTVDDLLLGLSFLRIRSKPIEPHNFDYIQTKTIDEDKNEMVDVETTSVTKKNGEKINGRLTTDKHSGKKEDNDWIIENYEETAIY